MSSELFSLLFKAGYGVMIGASVLVIFNAMISAKEMGGSLGQGLKKVAAGTICDTILIVTYLLLEKASSGLLSDEQIRLFFLFFGIFGAALLISGYIQMYRVSKKLKLFTV